jgi:hypothetical protein
MSTPYIPHTGDIASVFHRKGYRRVVTEETGQKTLLFAEGNLTGIAYVELPAT